MLLRCRDGRKDIVTEWDATDGRAGGAERTVWETLFEMERFDDRAGDKSEGSITPVLDPVVWVWATHLVFHRKIFARALRLFLATEVGLV